MSKVKRALYVCSSHKCNYRNTNDNKQQNLIDQFWHLVQSPIKANWKGNTPGTDKTSLSWFLKSKGNGYWGLLHWDNYAFFTKLHLFPYTFMSPISYKGIIQSMAIPVLASLTLKPKGITWDYPTSTFTQDTRYCIKLSALWEHVLK